MTEIRKEQAPMTETMGSPLEPDLDEFFNPNLPEDLKMVSAQFFRLACYMLENLPASAQRTQGLWDLLRAKDCAVRAMKGVLRESQRELEEVLRTRPDKRPQIAVSEERESDDSST